MTNECRFPSHRFCTRESGLCDLCDPGYAQIVEAAKEQWNKVADRWNQWEDLDGDERQEIIIAKRDGTLGELIRRTFEDGKDVFYVVMLKGQDNNASPDLTRTDGHIYFSREEAEAMVRDDQYHVVRMVAYVE
jgi:hypothetical protein